MASITVHGKPGATQSQSITSTANAAGSSGTIWVTGPPQEGHSTGNDGMKYAGRYMRIASTTYRWIEDFPVGASGTVPTGYTHDNV